MFIKDKRIYQPGDKVGSLIFIEELPPNGERRRGLFQCGCGVKFETYYYRPGNGGVKSCGCLMKSKNNIKHPLYSCWIGIKNRCYYKDHKHYSYYGGRGIEMADEFRNNFINFSNYVSSLPRYEDREKLGLTLDRIDNNKSYERDNLRWATKIEQKNNSRKVLWLELDGEKITFQNLARKVNIKDTTLYYRLFIKKMSIQDAISAPLHLR